MYNGAPQLEWPRRMFILKRYGQLNGMCYYCKKPVKVKDATCDHVIPLCRGGDDEESNWELACKPCNTKKGQRTAVEFLKLNP